MLLAHSDKKVSKNIKKFQKLAFLLPFLTINKESCIILQYFPNSAIYFTLSCYQEIAGSIWQHIFQQSFAYKFT